MDDAVVEWMREAPRSPTESHELLLEKAEELGVGRESRRTVERAFGAAATFHEGQLRGDGSPYIVHPARVALLAATLTAPLDRVDAICGGLLHDVLEDTAASEDDVLRLGGEAVLAIVKF